MRGGLTGLARLPGAQSQLPPEATGSALPAAGGAPENDRWGKLLGNETPGEPVEGRPLRRTLPDGGVLLLSRTPRELIANLYETLRDNEVVLLEEQVISERTKRAYYARGKTARDAAEWLVKNQAHVEALIGVMPAAEQTPGVFMKPLGQNAFRLTLGGSEMLELKYKTVDVVIEQGRFRLLMIQ